MSMPAPNAANYADNETYQARPAPILTSNRACVSAFSAIIAYRNISSHPSTQRCIAGLTDAAIYRAREAALFSHPMLSKPSIQLNMASNNSLFLICVVLASLLLISQDVAAARDHFTDTNGLHLSVSVFFPRLYISMFFSSAIYLYVVAANYMNTIQREG